MQIRRDDNAGVTLYFKSHLAANFMCGSPLIPLERRAKDTYLISGRQTDFCEARIALPAHGNYAMLPI